MTNWKIIYEANGKTYFENISSYSGELALEDLGKKYDIEVPSAYIEDGEFLDIVDILNSKINVLMIIHDADDREVIYYENCPWLEREVK